MRSHFGAEYTYICNLVKNNPSFIFVKKLIHTKIAKLKDVFVVICMVPQLINFKKYFQPSLSNLLGYFSGPRMNSVLINSSQQQQEPADHTQEKSADLEGQEAKTRSVMYL